MDDLDITTAEQQAYYDSYHCGTLDLPVERLKQTARLDTLTRLVDGRCYKRALVVGCGQGADVTILRAEMLTAFDLSRVAVSRARNDHPGPHYLQSDGTRLPFPSSAFDIVLCSEVVEHVLNPQSLLGEIARVLEPDGYLLLSTPNWISWWGLARKLGQLILRKPITSGEQPVDNWFTTRDLWCALSRDFRVRSKRGVWYFPPTGLGLRRIPDVLIAPFFRLLMPVDRLLGRVLPGLGHIHAWLAILASD
ncbi:MAG: class I SAM-dependent methyltransferase [Anaerolineae bacterium]|nr:class I SAM-dependent methyltransferase [Anaerolineae bacterium]